MNKCTLQRQTKQPNDSIELNATKLYSVVWMCIFHSIKYKLSWNLEHTLSRMHHVWWRVFVYMLFTSRVWIKGFPTSSMPQDCPRLFGDPVSHLQQSRGRWLPLLKLCMVLFWSRLWFFNRDLVVLSLCSPIQNCNPHLPSDSELSSRVQLHILFGYDF